MISFSPMLLTFTPKATESFETKKIHAIRERDNTLVVQRIIFKKRKENSNFTSFCSHDRQLARCHQKARRSPLVRYYFAQFCVVCFFRVSFLAKRNRSPNRSGSLFSHVGLASSIAAHNRA